MVQPQLLVASVMIKGASPVLVNVKIVSWGAFCSMVPKSCSILSNFITGRLLAAASLFAATSTLEASILLEAFSLQENITRAEARLSVKKILFMFIKFLIFSKLRIIFYNRPLPNLFNFPSSLYSRTNLSKTPFIKILLLGVEYSLAISKNSFMVTLSGMEGKFNSSQMAIFNNMASISAILSLSLLGVLPSISFSHLALFKRVLVKIRLA